MKTTTSILFFSLFTLTSLIAQKIDNEGIKALVEKYKADPKGPYQDIRWFCKDGTVIPPKEKCPEPGGVQRAKYKNEVVALGQTNHVFLGQILSNTPKEDFWDEAQFNSRLRQYQLEKYLRTIDNGWVLQRGQYYRGAFQVEDEQAWGIEFFTWLLSKDEVLYKQFFLLRQAVKDIPHRGEDSKTLSVRAISKTISDEYGAFQDLRVKIHGQPEASDIAKVLVFRDEHRSKLNANLLKQFDQLLADMKEVYKPVDLKVLQQFMQSIPKDSPIGVSLSNYITTYAQPTEGPGRIMATAEQLAAIRSEILNVKSRKARLALLDISNALEELFFRENIEWHPQTIGDAMEKICYASLAAKGTGFIEPWEWDQVGTILTTTPALDTVSLLHLSQFAERARSVVEWGSAMVNGVYKDVVTLYGGFEPLAYSFYDDRIRSSVLLNLGQTIGQLGDFIAQEANWSNKVLAIPNQSSIRGLNPGFAMGELVVVPGNENDIEVSKDKIYVFHHPPSDLKPVAGIATVTEGNMVSHVQLLARNLGIPNAVVSGSNLEDLSRYSGQQMFFAVSNRGTVVMKPVKDMTAQEKELFLQKERTEEKISVPIEKIDLSKNTLLNMRSIDATASGKICGPKAANLGQLKQLFPENVVEGLVIPFGVFKKHLDQEMPAQQMTYWAFLNKTFEQAQKMQKSGQNEAAVESFILGELNLLKDAIKNIHFTDDFLTDLDLQFQQAFGKPIGSVPVFLRSDTNMEDLKEFTGAGLNLTLFNVVEKDKIIQGIREVWASPYTERSFKWRQRYLLNPENVFPSILIIPSVDVDYSGVLITKGITNNVEKDMTIAFNFGAGGAVDGQSAESYLLFQNDYQKLLSPAREASYRRLPASGGTKTEYAFFNRPILNPQNLHDIRVLTTEIYEKLPNAPGIETKGPFDVELGFKDDHLWLFQVRPYVENKNALSSSYLEEITPKTITDKRISLETKLLSTL